MDKPTLIEGEDFYWEEKEGIRFRIFTESYLSKRGYCCKNGCRHCPFGFKIKNKNNGKDKPGTI